MRNAKLQHIRLDGQHVTYRLVASRAARKLRVRVGPGGVEVVQPKDRAPQDVIAFLRLNDQWILDQIKRVEHLRHVRRSERREAGQFLLRGELTRVRIEEGASRAHGNRVVLAQDGLIVRRSRNSQTAPARSLELWLRRLARKEIDQQLAAVAKRLKRSPRRVYVMDQRTKWGNCSAKQNLSFSWRIILAPDFVLRYLVTHEAVHLAIPDHSPRFWLTLQSLCPETERAKQWLSRNGERLFVSIQSVLE